MEWVGDEVELERSRQRFSQEFRELHSWIDEDEIGRLFSQGCYYAMK